ncbi:winged helix-turn-helix transcriptional regulator [Streptomyces sp. NPDC046465]
MTTARGPWSSALPPVGDKWSLLVVCRLDQGPRRFTELT